MTQRKDYIFTSESVGEGHPDKICDQISDAVLDDALRQDPNSHVACESFTTTGLVLVGGEITTTGYIDLPQLVRGVLKSIGYTDASYGIDYESCSVISTIQRQSPDIAQGVNGTGLHHEMGAGDQGMMFGYACTETPSLMPAPISLAHRIMQTAAKARKEGTLPFLRPDGKCQVSVQYRDGKPRTGGNRGAVPPALGGGHLQGAPGGADRDGHQEGHSRRAPGQEYRLPHQSDRAGSSSADRTATPA